jgi:hypothetical protein
VESKALRACTHFSFKRLHERRHISTFRHIKEEFNGNIEFLQLDPIVAADGMLAVETAIISAFLSLDGHMSQTDNPYVPKLSYQSVYCCRNFDSHLPVTCQFRISAVRAVSDTETPSHVF